MKKLIKKKENKLDTVKAFKNDSGVVICTSCKCGCARAAKTSVYNSTAQSVEYRELVS